MVEVLRRFDLFPDVAPFRRCIHCNTLLNPITKETILERLQPETRRYYDKFRLCPACHRIYWDGSHCEHMQRFIRRILAR